MSTEEQSPTMSSAASDFYGTTITLPQRIDKKGVSYDRTIQYSPGMKELTDIVAKLNKDVRKINECITLAGAESYAKKKGKNWSAFAADVTGPKGMKDGIEEIFVADSRGNVRVVNGVGLTKSDYPMRKAYRTVFPTKTQRKEKGNDYQTFRAESNEVSEERDALGHWQYHRDLANIAPEFKVLKKKITPKTVFKQALFKPVYDGAKEMYGEVLKAMYMAQLFNISLNLAYKEFVIAPLASQIGISEEQIDIPANKKKINSDAHKDTQMDIVNNMINNADAVFPRIEEILGDVADEQFRKQELAASQPVVEAPTEVKHAYIMQSPGRKTYTPKNQWESPKKA